MPLLIALAAVAAHPATATLDVSITGLRNSRGVVHACLTANARVFPDCNRDPDARKLTIPAAMHSLRFSGIAPGRYAVTLLHDENANHRLDTMLAIPREGFGFSRNPIVRLRAPNFGEVAIELGAGFTRQPVRMQYLL